MCYCSLWRKSYYDNIVSLYCVYVYLWLCMSVCVYCEWSHLQHVGLVWCGFEYVTRSYSVDGCSSYTVRMYNKYTNLHELSTCIIHCVHLCCTYIMEYDRDSITRLIKIRTENYKRQTDIFLSWHISCHYLINALIAAHDKMHWST